MPDSLLISTFLGPGPDVMMADADVAPERPKRRPPELYFSPSAHLACYGRFEAIAAPAPSSCRAILVAAMPPSTLKYSAVSDG